MRYEFPNFMQNKVKLCKGKFFSFLEIRDELDQFYLHSGIEIEKYPELSGIVHIVLTLNLSQGFVERGFSEQDHII